MESRTISNVQPTIITSIDGLPNNPVEVSNEYFPIGYQETFSVLTDNKLGDFKSPNPHSFVKTINQEMVGNRKSSRYMNGDLNSILYEVGVISSLPFSAYAKVFDDESYNTAVARLYEKLRGSVDLSVSLAQAGQVGGMFRAASKALHYAGTLNPRNWGKRWLEFTYGWRPLAQDLYGSIEQLSNSSLNSRNIIVTAKSNDHEKFSESTDYTSTQVEVRQDFRTRISVNLTPGVRTIDDLARFSSLNPASIAWELVPYSFVVDWFYDIGSYLRDAESALVYSTAFTGGYLTKTSLLKRVANTNGNGQIISDYSVTGTWSGSQTSASKQRALLVELPFPRKPTFKADLGASRLLSAAALLSNFVRLPGGQTTQERVQYQKAIGRLFRMNKRNSYAFKGVGNGLSNGFNHPSF